MLNTKKQTGWVRWFNGGEGVVRGDNDINYIVHWSAIKGAVLPSNTKRYDLKNKKFVNLIEGRRVIFTAIDDEDDRIVLEIEEI